MDSLQCKYQTQQPNSARRKMHEFICQSGNQVTSEPERSLMQSTLHTNVKQYQERDYKGKAIRSQQLTCQQLKSGLQ